MGHKDEAFVELFKTAFERVQLGTILNIYSFERIDRLSDCAHYIVILSFLIANVLYND